MLKQSATPIAARISVDLGGYHTRIFHETHGLILDEPSVGLIDMDHRIGGSSALGNFGNEALSLAPSLPSMRLTQVLQSDEHNPLGYSARMLRSFFSRLRTAGALGKAPVVLLTNPPGVSQALTDDLKHACFTAGASRVHLVDNAISTAFGAALNIDSGTPQLVLDLGARSARLYAFQFNDIVAAYSLPFGGDALDTQLLDGVRERYGIQISRSQAQQAKHRVGSAMPSILSHQQHHSCQLQGLHIADSQQVEFILTSEVACELLQPLMKQSADALRAAVQALPYQFRDPQLDVPIIITGGGAHLPQIDQLVVEGGDRPVDFAANPLTTAVRGGAELLSQIHESVTESV